MVRQPVRDKTIYSSPHPREPADTTPQKIGALLQEIAMNESVNEPLRYYSEPLDTAHAKALMKSMTADQQRLVETILGKLRKEQVMRLQSEEQHSKMLQQMVSGQQNLEQQIRLLKE